MIDQRLEIPSQSGNVLLVPPGRDLVGVARRNRDHLDGERRSILGVPLGTWRTRAREAVLEQARAYTGAVGGGRVTEGELVLATGHQPVFVHPGIWVKFLLVDRLAADGHTGLALIVDSDAVETSAVEIPTYAGPLLERRTVVLRTAGSDETYEDHAAPAEEEWRGFLGRVDALLRTVPEEPVQASWQAFAAQPRPSAGSFSAFMTAVRRRYEGPRRSLDVPISLVAETEAFRALFLHIVGDAERFRTVHNRHLDAYREQQRLRTEAQPFPNLDREGDWVELPYWSAAGGRRRPLWLQPARRRLRAGGAEVPVPAEPDDAAFSPLRLRPRALLLTLSVRLLFTDVFIHGVSGGRYDRVTDAVCADFLGVSPPAYATASATLHLPFAAPAGAEIRRRVLQHRIQEARHNPERVLTDPAPEQRALIDEKWDLIRRLEDPATSRRDRRTLTRRIRELNGRLAAALADQLAALEVRLAALDDRRGPVDAAAYREYPFFLYGRAAVEALVTRMLEGGS